MPKARHRRCAELAARVEAGDKAAAARALSWVVDELPGYEGLLRRFHSYAGQAHKVGVCGPPGCGKSTLIGSLIGRYRGQGLKVGTLVVDPSSPFSGGAFLGDRLRIQDHALDPGVFIRSLASRGMVGGVSATIFGAIRVLEAYRCQVLFIETVGTGQDEVEIAKVADTVLYVTAPSLGDEIQAMKAGTMDVADLFAVNKADLPDSERAIADIRRALSLAQGSKKGFAPPVLAVSALEETGVEELFRALQDHRRFLGESGEGRRRFREQLREEVSLLLSRKLYRDVLSRLSERHIEELVTKKTDPVTVARKVLGTLSSERQI